MKMNENLRDSIPLENNLKNIYDLHKFTFYVILLFHTYIPYISLCFRLPMLVTILLC